MRPGVEAQVYRSGLAAVLVALATLMPLRAQTTRFEVVSVKPTLPGTQGGGYRVSPGGRVAVTNSTLKGLVAGAYQRFIWDSREIVGGPDWFNETRFDVVALAPGGLPPVDADGFPSQLLMMLRAVLEDRFKLVVRWEKRQRPIYNLVLARADRRLGPQLVPVSVDCAQAAAAMLAGRLPEMRPGRGQECNLSLTSDPGSIQANAITMGVLARVLGPSGAGREVVDRTGLTGLFDVDLLHMPELPIGGLSVDALSRDPRFLGRPGMFTALEEQLGLKLVPATGPVDVLVVERAERPTED